MDEYSVIAVTGANGLAGSAVVHELQAAGYRRVIPITRKHGDLRSRHDAAGIFNFHRPEYVFHAAATVYGLQGNMDHQAKSIYDNTLINVNVIDACAGMGVKKIVAMGTNAVYPWPPKLPYTEETIFDGRPHDGEAAYGHAKRHMLAMLEAYKQSYGIDYAYIVSGNLYGPNDKFDPINGHVMPSLIYKFHQAMTNGGDVDIWGDGTATRDFLYSADLARAARIFLENPEATGAINTGSGQQASIQYVAKRLCSISGVDYGRVKWDISKPKGRPDCYADLSKQRALGFIPKFRLSEGMRETFEWYANRRSIA